MRRDIGWASLEWASLFLAHDIMRKNPWPLLRATLPLTPSGSARPMVARAAARYQLVQAHLILRARRK
jgi:hypothetical protein